MTLSGGLPDPAEPVSILFDMKIGLVIYGSLDTVSGGYLYDRKLVAYLRSCGDQVDIISLPAGSYSSHLLNNLSMRLPKDLDILVEDELVHPSLLWANRARQRLGFPILSLVHNLRSSERRPAWQNSFYRAVENSHLRSVDGYIFNSNATLASVTKLAGDGKPYVLAAPGGDRLGSLPLDAVSRRAHHSGPIRLLFLANVTPLKGLHVVLDSLKQMPPGVCTLDVAGSLGVDPAYAGRMERQFASLNLPVTFHGLLDEQPLSDLLAASDVLVVPSFWEGFGISFLEGMAFGLPAIGTTAGAMPQMITHGVNGYLITPGDSAALAGLIHQLAAHRGLLERMATNARQYFETRPSWAQSAEMVRGFLLRMLR
jgi:glycosyltransferase involved in cell wall biosynthesis